MSNRSKLLLFAVINFILTALIFSTSAKAMQLELDEEESTFSFSCSISVYAGTVTDSDNYQDLSLNHDVSGISGLAVHPASSVSISTSASGWQTLDGDDYAQHFFVWDWWGGATALSSPAGFSIIMNAEGNFVWDIATSTEDEDSNLPVFLHIDYSQNSFMEGTGSNASYEMGIYGYTFRSETDVSGPYDMELDCCPGVLDSSFPEEGDRWIVAHLGDSIRFSYNTSVIGGTDNPMSSSDLNNPLVTVYHAMQAYFSEVVFWDRETFEEVKGACSDGETQVVVELTLPYELFPNDENPACIRLTVLSTDGKDNGHFIEEGQDNDGDDYDDTPRIEWGFFTQTWCVPGEFDSLEHAANTASSRQISLRFEIDTDNNGTYDTVFVKQIDLVRPPVIMLHGLWGKGSDFVKLDNELDKHGWMFLYRPSYNNRASISQTIPILQDTVVNSLRNIREGGYAVTKADIVAHSMGGLIAKKLDTSFAQENIRKIITIGTPYAGSPFADLLIELKETNRGLFNVIQNIINVALATGKAHAIDGGAVNDLRSENNDGKTQIPGVDCSGIVVGYCDGAVELPAAFWSKIITVITGSDVAQEAHNILFDKGVMSDWIVSVPSQKGDASSWRLIPVEWHSPEPQDSDFHTLVLQWLNEPGQTMQQLSNTLKPENSISIQSIPTQTNSSGSLGSIGTIEIASPVEGQLCMSGQPLNVSIHGTGDTSKAAIFTVFGSSSWADIVGLPWTGNVIVPIDSVGSAAKIFVIGLDANMNMTSEEEVDLILESNIVLQDIVLGFDNIWYFDLINNPAQSRQLQLYPMGKFSDGSEHPLSISGQISYVSSDESVATVDLNGLITIHAKGTSEITITNSSVSIVISIEVVTYPGDINFDGRVDVADFAIVASQWLWLDCINPDWCEGADINMSGQVDLEDISFIVEYWLEGADFCSDDADEI